MWGYIWHNRTRFHAKNQATVRKKESGDTQMCTCETVKCAQGQWIESAPVSCLLYGTSCIVLAEQGGMVAGHAVEGMWLSLYYFLLLHIHLNHLKIL